MSRLEQLINELCPNGVEYRKLEKCCNILDRQRKPVTKSARETGEYPYYGANGIQDYVSDYIFDGTFVLVGEDGSVITKNGNPVVTWAQGKIWVNNHAHIIGEIDGVLLRYLYHFIQTVDVTSLIHGNIPKLTGGDFKTIPIPLPPLPVQEEIVRILDNFTELTSELTAELTARKKQYEYYRDNLLSNPNATFEPLVTLADIGTGSSNTNEGLEVGNYPLFVRSQEVRRKNEFQFDETAIITSGDGVGVGKIFHYIEGKYALHQRAYRIHITSDRLIPKFFFYYMKTSFLKYIEKNAVNSSVTSVRRPMMDKFPVPLPSIEEQQRIVNILNRFDTLCNDISNGLPAEIKQRKQQYEYYRNKLLTFSKAEIEV